MKGHFFEKDKLVKILDNTLNKTLGEIDCNNVFDKTIDKPKITGIAGDVIEQSVLGLPADNKQRPDLDIEGVDTELKTTGIRLSKKRSNAYEAKEPMSITAVSPKKIINEIFESSNFWHKLEHMLLIYYHYDSDKTVPASGYSNFYIKGYEFHNFTKTEKAGLMNDWKIVQQFIISLNNEYDTPENEYPRLSSELRSKLLYIDTAPKWPNPPRFRLKRQVVTNIVQNHFGNSLEQLPGFYTSYDDIDNKCHILTNQYCNKTISQLINDLNIHVKLTKQSTLPKSIAEQIVVGMFGGKSKKISQIDLFNKIGLFSKTITLTSDGLRTEDMKLFPINFGEWTSVDTEFEDSLIYDYFSNHQLMCIVFEEESTRSPLSTNRFIGFKRLSFNDDFISNEVHKIWLEIRNLVNNNQLVEEIILDKNNKPRINKTGETMTSINFPKSKDNNIFVRGTGSDSSKKPLKVNGISMYRQDIWIKGSYIADLLKNCPYL